MNSPINCSVATSLSSVFQSIHLFVRRFCVCLFVCMFACHLLVLALSACYSVSLHPLCAPPTAVDVSGLTFAVPVFVVLGYMLPFLSPTVCAVLHIYIYIYIHVSVCLCVYVFLRYLCTRFSVCAWVYAFVCPPVCANILGGFYVCMSYVSLVTMLCVFACFSVLVFVFACWFKRLSVVLLY